MNHFDQENLIDQKFLAAFFNLWPQLFEKRLCSRRKVIMENVSRNRDSHFKVRFGPFWIDSDQKIVSVKIFCLSHNCKIWPQFFRKNGNVPRETFLRVPSRYFFFKDGLMTQKLLGWKKFQKNTGNDPKDLTYLKKRLSILLFFPSWIFLWVLNRFFC